MVAPAYHGGRGTEGTRWFVPGADRCLPWERGGGASAAGGSSETLVAVMARRAPAPSVILRDAMCTAEAAACEVVLCVQPTKEAEQHRQDVISYLKRLIGSTVGCEVFAFGSVPLRTYLPDGDVDITVLGNTWLNSTFIDDVRGVLESEQENCDAEFKLTGLHFINAEVKLMKCVIENIVVDVSFNQIGGVSTFCFLELVDRQVGKNHLFKRSIMLIKAWCYHESRVLGAHHGLISTYALETLVLYIFNMFHKSLHGPLEALYWFLEYFSKFDWDKYGISLNGLIELSSLPNLTVEPTTGHDELLLDQEFLRGFLDRLVVFPNESDGCDAQFRQKFLNIVDPLKGNNNLGRSVSKVNFYRIRSAFSFGAQQLGQILMLSPEFIRNEIYGVFANTLKRYGKGERSDIGNSSFQSLLGPESALGEVGSRLKTSCMNESENRSSLPDKDLSMIDVHKDTGRSPPCLVQDLPWNKVWFMECAYDFSANSSYFAGLSSQSSFSFENGNGDIKDFFENYAAEADLHLSSRLHMPQHIYGNHQLHTLTNSTCTNILDIFGSCPVNESDWTAQHADKKPFLPFLRSNMLDLLGDLDLHLGCLRKVQYHLESLFDELLRAVEEPYLAGGLDEDSSEIPTMIFNSKSNSSTKLSLASSIDNERRKLSPIHCSHSTGNDSQQSRAEAQVGELWWQNLSLSSSGPALQNLSMSSNGLALFSSPSAISDNYLVSWFCVSPKSQGTGTCIPKTGFYSYQDQKTIEREILQEKKKRQKAPGHHYPEQGYSGSQTKHATTQSATNQPPKKQTSLQQNSCSSKSSIPSGDFVDFKKHVATKSGTKQEVGRDFIEKGRRHRPALSPGLVLPHNGQGNPPVLKACQPSSPTIVDYQQLKVQDMESLEFGSMGPFSLGIISKQFKEAFPALPARKSAEEVIVPASNGPAEVPTTPAASTKPVETESRSQEVYQLRDEAHFPPLQAGCRKD